MEVAVKKTGNPNFGKKKPTTDAWGIDAKQIYYFQLCQTHEKNKPKDAETGELRGGLYPEIQTLPNEGVALDPITNLQRRWRLVYGYSSIWTDEQLPEPTKQQLEDNRNYIQFHRGLLKIQGVNAPKIMALLVQDSYEGNENPIQQTPHIFRMLDETKELFNKEDLLDIEFEAMNHAKNCSYEEMLPVAIILGIDTSATDDEEGQRTIRAKFKQKAKDNPKAFLKMVKNPRTEVKGNISMALKKGLISSATNRGYLTVVETGVTVLPINSDGDIEELFTCMVMAEDEKAVKLYNQLKKQL